MGKICQSLALLVALACWPSVALAATCTSLSAGRWDLAARWSCGHIPLATDTVVIAHNSVQMRGNYTVAGLTVNAGAVLDGDNRNLTVNGVVAINGTYNTNGGNLTTTGGGALSVNAGGAFDFNGGNATINGNVVINGTLSSGGDGMRMTGASTTLSGTGNVVNTTLEIDATGISVPVGANLKFDVNSEIDVAANVSPASLTVNGTIDGTAQAAGDRIIRVSTGGSLTVSSTGVINAPSSQLSVRTGASATNNGAITIGDLLGRTGSPTPVFTQGVNSTLNINITACSTTDPCTFNASAAGNSVNYSGAAQTVKLPSGAPAAYYNLTLSGNGAKTMPTGMTVAGNFTMSGTATTTAPAALTVSGNFSIGASNTFTPGAGTVTLNGASAQTIGGGAADLSLFNLTVNNSVGITLARNVIVTGTLTGPVTLTNTCPTDFTLTSGGGATVQHSCPASVGPHHVRVQHDGNGLTCTPAILTVIACANAACAAPYYTAGAVSGNVTWAGAPGGSVAFNITTNGTTTVNLAVTTVQTVTLGTSAVSPAPLNGSDCVNTAGGAACSLPFADSGLLMSAPDHAAETVQNLTISAVRKANNALNCVPAFANVARAVNLKCAYINPASGTLPVRVAGTALNATNNANAACDATGQLFSLSFDGSGTATTTLQYADVGQMALDASYAGSAGTGDAGLVMTGSDAFVAKPAGFGLSGIQRSSDAFANPAAADAAGLAFIKAGDDFTVTVTAMNALGNATPNYGKETPAESVKLTPVLVGGLGLTNNPAVGGTFGAFSNGAATGATFTWGEVGIITLTPGVADANYLAAGDVVGSASGNVGRFYPHHFALSANSMTNRVQSACAPASSFTYAGEQFQAGFTLTAQNAANTVTQNYATANSFAKLDGTVIANFNFGAIDLADAIPPTTATPNLSLGLVSSSGTWAAGVGVFTANLGLNRAAAPDGPYESFNLGVAPGDADGTALASYNLDVNNDTANDHGLVGAGKIRFGRVKLSSAHGSELLELPIPIEKQYWNGAAFVANTADTCTTFNASDIAMSFPVDSRNNLAACETSVSMTGVLKLTKPGAGNNGWADLRLNLGATASGTTCIGGTAQAATTANRSYLQGAWTGATYTENPSVRATFGVYQSPNEFIYMRENY